MNEASCLHIDVEEETDPKHVQGLCGRKTEHGGGSPDLDEWSLFHKGTTGQKPGKDKEVITRALGHREKRRHRQKTVRHKSLEAE